MMQAIHLKASTVDDGKFKNARAIKPRRGTWLFKKLLDKLLSSSDRAKRRHRKKKIVADEFAKTGRKAGSRKDGDRKGKGGLSNHQALGLDALLDANRSVAVENNDAEVKQTSIGDKQFRSSSKQLRHKAARSMSKQGKTVLPAFKESAELTKAQPKQTGQQHESLPKFHQEIYHMDAKVSDDHASEKTGDLPPGLRKEKLVDTSGKEAGGPKAKTGQERPIKGQHAFPRPVDKLHGKRKDDGLLSDRPRRAESRTWGDESSRSRIDAKTVAMKLAQNKTEESAIKKLKGLGKSSKNTSLNPTEALVGKTASVSSAGSSGKVIASEAKSEQSPMFVQQLASRVAKAFATGRTSVSIRLDPPDLGEVKVLFSKKAGKLHLLLQCAQSSSLKLLEPEIHVLERRLAESGIDHDGVDLAQTNTGEREDGPFEKSSRQEEGITESIASAGVDSQRTAIPKTNKQESALDLMA